jgi:nonsense-mediated mRNA decay protein 3
VKQSKQLISNDLKNNEATYKFTLSLEIAPVCKDDLVLLPKALSKEIGGLGPLVLVYKISTFVHIVDIISMKTYELDQVLYWKNEFEAIMSRDRLTEFVVINIWNTDYNTNVSKAAARQKFKMVQVELARAADYGSNDKTFIVNTHLGEILNYNDTVLCYDLEASTSNMLEELES